MPKRNDPEGLKITKNAERIAYVSALLDEFSYRHSVYWKIIYNTSYIVIGLYSGPLLFELPFTSLGDFYVMAFPIAGILFTLSASSILGSEYEMLSAIENRMNEVKRALDKSFLDYPRRNADGKLLNEALAKRISMNWTLLMLLLGILELLFFYFQIFR